MQKGKSTYNISDSPDLYPTAVFVINKYGVIFNTNKLGLSLISSKKENIINKNFLGYLDENGKNNFQQFFYKTSNSSEPQTAEINFKGIDNNYFPALAVAKSITFTESADKFCSVS